MTANQSKTVKSELVVSEIEEGDVLPARPKHRRQLVEVLNADCEADEFCIRFEHKWDTHIETVSGSTFRAPVTEVDDAISDPHFDSLTEGGVVTAYVTGHEVNSRLIVEDINPDDKEALLVGEVHNQSVGRWVPQSLIYAPEGDE